jgi:hypothetical protein
MDSAKPSTGGTSGIGTSLCRSRRNSTGRHRHRIFPRLWPRSGIKPAHSRRYWHPSDDLAYRRGRRAAHLEIQRPAIATSYLADIDARLAEVLEKSGFEVTAIRGMGLKKSIDMGKVSPEETYRLAREVVRSARKADGILISCGNLRTFEAIQALEVDTGLPVVTSNQAGLWQALRMAGIKDRLTSLGRLLREH